MSHTSPPQAAHEPLPYSSCACRATRTECCLRHPNQQRRYSKGITRSHLTCMPSDLRQGLTTSVGTPARHPSQARPMSIRAQGFPNASDEANVINVRGSRRLERCLSTHLMPLSASTLERRQCTRMKVEQSAKLKGYKAARPQGRKAARLQRFETGQACNARRDVPR